MGFPIESGRKQAAAAYFLFLLHDHGAVGLKEQAHLGEILSPESQDSLTSSGTPLSMYVRSPISLSITISAPVRFA